VKLTIDPILENDFKSTIEFLKGGALRTNSNSVIPLFLYLIQTAWSPETIFKRGETELLQSAFFHLDFWPCWQIKIQLAVKSVAIRGSN